MPKKSLAALPSPVSSIAVPHVTCTVAGATIWTGHEVWPGLVIHASHVVIAEARVAVRDDGWWRCLRPWLGPWRGLLVFSAISDGTKS